METDLHAGNNETAKDRPPSPQHLYNGLAHPADNSIFVRGPYSHRLCCVKHRLMLSMGAKARGAATTCTPVHSQ